LRLGTKFGLYFNLKPVEGFAFMIQEYILIIIIIIIMTWTWLNYLNLNY